MPTYRVRLINSEFDSADDSKFASLDAARKSAVQTAAKVAVESIAQGEPASAVEVQIFKDERMLSRQVVTFSVVDLTANADANNATNLD